jgi:DNA invertase Pin-like site-specific DNA recombinase
MGGLAIELPLLGVGLLLSGVLSGCSCNPFIMEVGSVSGDRQMSTLAYFYYNPILETRPDVSAWGWTFDRVYEDADSRRSQLQVLRQDAAQSPPGYLVLRRLEELGDSLKVVTDCLSEFESLGICVVALEQNYRSESAEALSTSNPNLLAFLALLDDVQQQQRSRKIRQGHAQNRIKGLPPPGKAPYGYRRGRDRYVVDKTVAMVVREFFEQFLLYGSLRGAVRHIEKKYGKKISVSTGQYWLMNPAYRGDLSYQDQSVLSDTHTPLISRDEAAQVDRLMRRNRSLAPRAASASRSLSGLVVCRQCQSSMTVSRVTAHRQTYEYLYLRPITCSQQPKCKALPYEAVLEKTIERICQDLPNAIAGLPLPPLNQIKSGLTASIDIKQSALDQLPNLVVQQVLDEQTADLRAYTLKTEIAEIRNRLSQLPPVNLLETSKTVSIPQFWIDLSETERRFYFREFIRAIEIVRHEQDWSVNLNFIF